jgi:D-alanyl-lipoteichoic acid acyltransferase DltB (MBOAT superfamily)
VLFNTPEYFIFLIIVLILYYALTRRFQNYMLLLASYIFYAFWDYRFLSLILISTTVDYLVGRAIYRATDPGRRRWLLLVSLAVNLGILGFFKYFNFFANSAERLLSTLGFSVSLPVLYVILPVGISFYTFQTMAYTIEVYRGQMRPVDSFLDFALYVCYFPQLVAGPIERPQNLLPQLQARRTVSTDRFITGCVLILIGLFRKVVIADGIGAQIDPIFAAPGSYSTPELLKGLYLFALQIYCDFAGYSDIARGTSRLLGIELMRNFNQPYFSATITEFWRRWHISLSTWLRDYLFIPLGGSRHGTSKTYRNLMVTMLLGGLWHGAAWTFVIWGGLHGLYLAGERFLGINRQAKKALEYPTAWDRRRVLGLLVTFHLVLLSWVFFRSSGLSTALNYLVNLFSFRGMETIMAVLPAVLIPWALVLLVDVPQFITGRHTVLLGWPRLVRNLAVTAMLFLILLGVGTRAPFIYFQF